VWERCLPARGQDVVKHIGNLDRRPAFKLALDQHLLVRRGVPGGEAKLAEQFLCMRQGLAPEMDVYDAATWSAPGPLSEMSVAGGSSPVEFPDFTRGRWKKLRESGTAGVSPG
jgi:hypothetical protein